MIIDKLICIKYFRSVLYHRLIHKHYDTNIINIIFLSLKQPKETEISLVTDLRNEFNSLKSSWISSCRQLANSEAIDWTELRSKVYSVQTSSRINEKNTFSMGVTALQQLGLICIEQDRLRAQFVIEICHLLSENVKQAANKLSAHYWGVVSDFDKTSSNERVRTVEELVNIFRKNSVSCRGKFSLSNLFLIERIFLSTLLRSACLPTCLPTCLPACLPVCLAAWLPTSCFSFIFFIFSKE